MPPADNVVDLDEVDGSPDKGAAGGPLDDLNGFRPKPDGPPETITALHEVVDDRDHDGASASSVSTGASCSESSSSVTLRSENASSTVGLDRYGFEMGASGSLIGRQASERGGGGPAVDAWLENKRTMKWLRMFADWDKVKSSSTIKRRIRKGIPDSLRAKAWPLLVGSQDLPARKADPNRYQKLLQQTPDPSVAEDISKDINRTFPTHSMFSGPRSIGQECLQNVLRAYSLHNPTFGYCQAIAYVAAIFLSYMPEVDAFWMLVAVLESKKHNLQVVCDKQLSGTVELLQIFKVLLGRYSKKLALHMENECMDPTMYATQWLCTMFARDFHFELVTRVYDVFLHEGWKVIHRVAMAILMVNEKEIRSRSFEDIMYFFKEIHLHINAAEVMDKAFSISVTKKEIEKIKMQQLAA